MIKSSAYCLFFSQDRELAQQVEAYLTKETRVRNFDDVNQVESQLRQITNAILLIDLRSEGSLPLCRDLARHRPDLEIIVLGIPHSMPMQEADALGVYAREELPLVQSRFQAIVHHSFEHLALRLENDSLRGQVALRQTPAETTPMPPATQPHMTGTSSPLGSFSRSLRNIQNVNALMESIVESVASSCLVSRVGIFARTRNDTHYRLYAGLRCMGDSRNSQYEQQDALVRWLEVNACQVVRSHLTHIDDFNDRLMLQQELDTLGAEVILPLQGRSQLWGWLFVGQRGTGVPFAYADLEQLLVMADHISTTLENAFLYEEAAIQKNLAETLLHSVPTGIVSIGTDGIIRSLNHAAEICLDVRVDNVRGKPIGMLGSRMADVLLRALHQDPVIPPSEWIEPGNQNSLVVEARRLLDSDNSLGAVAFIQDVTQQRRLEEKQEQVERTSFWTDLAASMSHEVRNPLVAIKTFAQLLPERYDEPDFRAEFSRIVTDEVDRLNKIIEQINDFANPPALKFSAVRLQDVLQHGIGKAVKQDSHTDVPITTSFDADLPAVSGDINALSECFANLITNALEATYDRGNPAVELKAQRVAQPSGGETVMVTVADNGPGIPSEFRDKVFSPFCTSKPRGMGLGLPIAKRTVIDHNGTIDIDTAPEGTQVVILLPTGK